MKQIIKRAIQQLIGPKETELAHSELKSLGVDPFFDMRHFLKGIAEPTIADVGANVGQTAKRFLDDYPDSRIHSFEPSPSTYEKLQAACLPYSNVESWNYGVGSANGVLTFIENEVPEMSSFLAPSNCPLGKVKKTTDVEVVTLDSFARDHHVDYFHILKSDTQGFDFEVFKGAQNLMIENRIALIYFEFIFDDMYENLPSFDQVFRYLEEKGYSLVSFYEVHFHNELASWTDVLFINREFHRERVKESSVGSGD